jgi:hypothetical protein
MVLKRDFNQQVVSPPPSLSISKEIPSRPGAFPDLSLEMAITHTHTYTLTMMYYITG